jgi:transcription antitermination factor NusG
MSTGKWLIIELSEQLEGFSYSDISQNVKNLFGERVEYFIPVYQEKMGSYTSTCTLFDGYVFVKDSPGIRACLPYLRDYRMFSKALGCGGRIQTVDSTVIGVMKRRLKKSTKRNLDIGSKVKVLEGIFSNLVGEVVGVDDGGKRIMVKIKTLSREMIAPVPSTSIEEILV